MIFLISYQLYHYYKNGGNVILYISNQSSNLETVDIKVLVNGKVLVCDIFPTENFHNYKKYPLKISPFVLHKIEVVSEKAQVKKEEQLRFFFMTWVMVDFWSDEIDSGDYSENGVKSQNKNLLLHWFTIERWFCPIVLM